MAIEKYTTLSLVLDAYDNGEHDKVYKLFTRDFGMIFAKATSIRKLESKLRMHIHVGRISTITMVKGKEQWRITGGEESKIKSPLLADAAVLIARFVRGEGSQRKLFDHVYALLSKEVLDEKIGRLLLYTMILIDLGYADAEVLGIENIDEYKGYSVDAMLVQVSIHMQVIRRHIKEVLSELQL